MPKYKILLASSCKPACARLAARLSAMGYAVACAQSLDELKTFCAGSSAFAILLDCRLAASLSGAKKLAQRITEEFAVPVLISSGKAKASSGPLFPELRQELEALKNSARARKRVAADKRWLEPLLMSVSDALVAVDSKGVVNFMNSAAETLSGLSAQRCIGSKVDAFMRLIHENGGAPLDNPVFEAMARRKHVRAPLDILLATEAKRTFVGCKAAPVYSEGGAVRGAVLSLWDVTVQKMAKMELQLSEEQYRTLVENAGSVILRTDKAGKIIFFNAYAQRFFSCREEALRGREFDKALKARLSDTLPLLLSHMAAAPDKAYSLELEHDAGRAEPVWLSWTFKAARSKSGRMEILCVGVDITPLKDAQKELARANELLEQRVAERTRELGDAYEKLKEAHQSLIQLEKMAALGRFSAGIAHEIKNPLGIILSGAEYLLMKGTARAQYSEAELSLIDQRELVAALERDAILPAGTQDYLSALNAVVADTGLYDKHFRADKRLRERRDITRLAMASEEFRRQPRSELLPHEICAAEFLNRLCLEAAYPGLSPHSPGAETYEALLKIKEAVLRADTIVKNLLKFSRPSDLKREVLPPEEAVESALSNIPEQERARAGIQTSYEKDLFIEGDRNQLVQVVINIITNALQSIAAGAQGRLFIRTYKSASAAGTEPMCVIEVRDNGVGISKDNLPRLFEPFFTTKVYDKTIASKGKAGLGLISKAGEAVQGTGLGLSVSKAIMSRHKGDIQVQSVEGSGTVVCLKLPLSSKKNNTTGSALL